MQWFPKAETKLEEVWEAVDGTQKLLTKAGFEFRFDSKTGKLATSLTYGKNGGRAAVKINITEAASLYMPGSEQMWEVGSGATHSRNWFTGGLDGHEDLLYIMAVTPTLDFTDAVIDSIHDYVGLSATEFHRRAHFRRTALLRRNPIQDPSVVQASYDEYAVKRSRR